MIAIVVLTHNRAHLLERCVDDVLLRTSDATKEIVIWDNASDDETNDYLRALAGRDPRVNIVLHSENIGTNAYARAVELTTSPYIVEVDDDVIEAPHGWDETLLKAFIEIPKMGYLVADLKEDPNDSAYRYLKYAKEERKVFTRKEIAGFTILEGPTGGGCSMTSREIYNLVGGFRQHKKLEFHVHRRRVNARKDLVKRLILALPFAAALNERYRWFGPPDNYQPPEFG